MSTSVDDNVAYNLRSRRITIDSNNSSKKSRKLNPTGGNKKPSEQTQNPSKDSELKQSPTPFVLDHLSPVELKKVLAEVLRNSIKQALMNRKIEAIAYAEKALKQYNSNKHSNFKFKEVTAVKITISSSIHLNFTAEYDDDDDASPKLFYADLYAVRDCKKPMEVEVKYCCVLEKFDYGSVDPKSGYCSLCGTSVIHPSPSYGYRCATGDGC